MLAQCNHKWALRCHAAERVTSWLVAARAVACASVGVLLLCAAPPVLAQTLCCDSGPNAGTLCTGASDCPAGACAPCPTTTPIPTASPATPGSANVQVTYLVQAKPFRAAVVGTPLTFTLYGDSACTTVIGNQVVNAENLMLVEQLKRLIPKGAPKGPSIVRITTTLTGVTATPTTFLTVTGTGVVPADPTCQKQSASGNGCAPDAVSVGPLCVDRYEATVFETTNDFAIEVIRAGGFNKVSLKFIVTPHGQSADDFGPVCLHNGNNCLNFYAVSAPGLLPSTNLTWFQAQQFCLNSGKRLLTNAEWQGAADGTPNTAADDGSTDCNVMSGLVKTLTGSRSNCVSRWGVWDMRGNVSEWTADWTDRATDSTGQFSDPLYGHNIVNIAIEFDGASASLLPGAFLRGGAYYGGGSGWYVNGYGVGGPFALSTALTPDTLAPDVGFRCVR